MPPSEGQRYCLTCVDRFTRWPEVFPLPDQEAETVARVFYEGWICRFGTPLRVTTDQGRQFESHLFQALSSLTGTTHLRTTAYHPQANGMVERFHRQLKTAIKCHETAQWTRILPSVLLGIRAAWKDDLEATSAELVYGETLRLPGEFLTATEKCNGDAPNFVRELREHFRKIRPTQPLRHGERKIFVFKNLQTCKHVFIRHDAQRNILQMPYDGPFEVISRSPKSFVVRVNGRDSTISIDRLKPAYTLDDENATENVQEDEETPTQTV